jgi:predicted naringenin-chalcone synthase
MFITDLETPLPPFSMPQGQTLDWLAKAWSQKQGRDYSSTRKLFNKVGCTEDQIAQRYYYLPEFNENADSAEILNQPQGQGHFLRTKFFSETITKVLNDSYEKRSAPDQLIHVTCTGYVSPSPAQTLSVSKWAGKTEVLHSYHMGCYASIPALKTARGLVAANPKASADIFHSELCTLHINLYESNLEQMVIQTLFADGCAVYRVQAQKPQQGFEIVDLRERLLPGTADAMTWITADHGMKMSLSKDVPRYVGQNIKSFFYDWVTDLKAQLNPEKTVFAIHPGGPKILDFVSEALELRPEQIKHSTGVLFERGNMSSATLPHIWKKIVDDPSVPSDTDIISFAFGPGLTVAAGWLRKV